MRNLYKISSDWKNIEFWLAWADSNNILFRIFNNDEFSGFAVARPIKDLNKVGNYYYFETGGDIVWIDIACSKIYNGTKFLWQEMLRKLNNFKYIGFKRNGGNTKVYDFNRFSKLMKVDS